MIDKKGLWKYVIHKTNEDFDGGTKQMWVGIKGILGQQAGEADTGIATLRAQNGKMVSCSKEKREALAAQYLKLGTLTANETFVAEFDKGYQLVGRGEYRCIRKRRPWFKWVTERVHKRRSKEACS